MKLLIVTGLSGAGKSLAVNALEDIGYFCMDNIPAGVLPKLMQFSMQSESSLQQVAIVLDIRGGKSADEIEKALVQLHKDKIEYKVLFLDAQNHVLERRYKETRRRHPISLLNDVPLSEAIAEERNILQPLYSGADFIIDTSVLSTAQLKERVVSMFTGNTADAMAIHIMSFGFKYGLPKESDIVFDVRCLPNPFYIPELKHKTGLDTEVAEYVMQFPESRELYQKLLSLVEFSVPLYVKEGKSQLMISIGCTGGKHRSITFAQMLGKSLEGKGYHLVVSHRDASRT